MKTPRTETSTAAQFISHRIYDLLTRRSQFEIATAAGFKSPGMLSMIKEGKAKLPLDRVVSLAAALECDPVHLFRLALRHRLGQALFNQIFAGGNGPMSVNEATILERVRSLSNNTDPNLTPERDVGLTRAFAPTRRNKIQQGPAATDPARTYAILNQVAAAQRDLRETKHRTITILIAIGRVGERLDTLQAELDLFIKPRPS